MVDSNVTKYSAYFVANYLNNFQGHISTLKMSHFDKRVLYDQG